MKRYSEIKEIYRTNGAPPPGSMEFRDLCDIIEMVYDHNLDDVLLQVADDCDHDSHEKDMDMGTDDVFDIPDDDPMIKF